MNCTHKEAARMSEPFGFTVQQAFEYERTINVPAGGSPYTEGREIATDSWQVELPHQCGNWLIIDNWPREGSNHEKAVAELERFIAEAQAALTALRERREFPTKETP